MTKLWQKPFDSAQGKPSTKLHPLIETYTVGDGVSFDQVLLPYDILASAAHAEGLKNIGILSAAELAKLKAGLNKLKKLYEQGKVLVTVADEDCHTVIENFLVEELGDVGKKIHSGRSRNDQVLVAVRLYLLDQLGKTQKEVAQTARDFLSFAKKHQNVPMPGYTHTQQAMLSSVGHWAASFVEALLDDCAVIGGVMGHVSKNPLGSAAGFGVSLPLDRELTTKKLGLLMTQTNSLYCQASRGKFESVVLEALVQVMLTLGKFAQDLLLFTSQEFAFFSADDSLTTGSSIMPQKKNHDALEILRGKVSKVISHQHFVQDLCKNLISGYHRDLQLINAALMDSFAIVQGSLAVAQLYLKHLKPNQKEMEKKITKEIFAADVANELVKSKGIPFRDAYLQAMERLDEQEFDLQKNLKSKISLGAPGNLNLKGYETRLKSFPLH
ncbi:MAG: argininosuccinate lyase [bacterium]|nr:argininosuccinate lyase [bacterium]